MALWGLLTQYKEGRKGRRRLLGWEGHSDRVGIGLLQKVDLLRVSFHKTKGNCEDWWPPCRFDLWPLFKAAAGYWPVILVNCDQKVRWD